MPHDNKLQTIIKRIWNDDIPGYSANENNQFEILGVDNRRLSTVYQVNLVSTLVESKKIYVKISKFANGDQDIAGKKLKHEFDQHLDAYTKIQPSSKFSIVQPLCVYPDIPAIVTESFPNSKPLRVPIIEYLLLGGKKRKASIEQLLFSTGEMLREFHSPHNQDIENLNQVQSELGEYINLRLKLIDIFLLGRSNEPQRTTESLFDDFKKRTVLEDCPGFNMMTRVHGDFTPGNILHDGKRLALIDFSEAVTAPQALDVGGFVNYLNMLPLNKPVFSRKRAKYLVSVFMDGYGQQTETELALCKLFQFRFLTTNLLTQTKEMQKSTVKNILMHKRITRYLKEMETVLA